MAIGLTCLGVIHTQSDMQRGVHGRLMDNSTSVREAAVELLGRFVLSRPQLTEQYYDMLIERILVRTLALIIVLYNPALHRHAKLSGKFRL